MKEQYVQTLPERAIGKGLGFSIERWNQLSISATDGKQNIDNNPVEDSSQDVATGRPEESFICKLSRCRRAKCDAVFVTWYL